MYRSQTNNSVMIEQPVDFYPGNKKILFVDNDMASYYLVVELLRDYDIEIIHSDCGLRAVRYVKQNSFTDAVITEIKVPRLDGFGILKEIRKINPYIPVIAQTAYVHDNMKQKCMKAGFREYISKPIDLELFRRIVIRYVLQFAGRN